MQILWKCSWFIVTRRVVTLRSKRRPVTLTMTRTKIIRSALSLHPSQKSSEIESAKNAICGNMPSWKILGGLRSRYARLTFLVTFLPSIHHARNIISIIFELLARQVTSYYLPVELPLNPSWNKTERFCILDGQIFCYFFFFFIYHLCG